MKIINQSVELNNPIPEPTDKLGVLQYIERIGRSCYKSEDKITETSAKKFIQMLMNRKHWAMLEHYLFTFTITEFMYQQLITYMANCQGEEKIKLNYIRLTHWKEATGTKYEYMLTASPTSINYMAECCNIKGMWKLYLYMLREYPDLCCHALFDRVIGKLDQSTKGVEFVSREKVKELPLHIRIQHDWMSAKFITNRGVTHEMVRHRPFSYAQESTRYCNYSKNTFNNEITVIFPKQFDTGMGLESNSDVYTCWRSAMESAETSYFKLLKYGATAQEARGVLPNDLKTEIHMTGQLYAWQHFFDMRTAPDAHPQIRELACDLLQQANNSFGEAIFNSKEES